MIEVDGPETDTPFPFKGELRHYTGHVIVGAEPGIVLEQYERWRRGVEDPENVLIWRERPHWAGHVLDQWTLSWRCAVVKVK